MRIIFMGSPVFAVPALQTLLDSDDHDIFCVYTREPKPCGRGHKLQKTPIHILAENYNIPVLTPKSLKNETIPAGIDAIIVAAYGMLLPRHILESTKYGCINIHPSLLPRWRGAAPIQYAILSGDKNTGVCIMQMTEALDAGDVLSVQEIKIEERDDYNIIHDKLALIGANLLVDVLDNIKNIIPKSQDKKFVTYANKIVKESIDWNDNVIDIVRKIRAYQGMDCILKGKRIKILKAMYNLDGHDYMPGNIINNQLYIACSEGVLIPQILQLPGKKATSIEEFLNGNKYLF